MTEQEKQATEDALARWRDQAFADLIVIVLGLAAQRQPEAMRHALASVFDVAGIKKQYATLKADSLGAHNDLRGLAAEFREFVRVLSRQIDDIEKRMDAINLKIDELEGPPQLRLAEST